MGTKIPHEYITIESMGKLQVESSNHIGIHSVVIKPEYQKKTWLLYF